MQRRPAPQEYTEYSAYLRDMVAHLKATTKTFSYRAFAQRGGFGSVGFLKHLVEGERNLALKSVEKVARGLSLSEQEARGLELLVMLNEAPSDAERTRLLRKLRASTVRRQIGGDDFELYSNWYVIPIRELLGLSGMRAEPGELAKRIFPNVGVREAKHAIDLLERVGVLQRTEAGDLVSKGGTLETAPQVKSLAVRNYHRDMLQRAAQSLEELPVQERNVTSVTVRLTDKQYQAVCGLMDGFQNQVLESANENSEDQRVENTEVYNLSFALVPVTRRSK
jgi:uncharacterized protein (TIGR02147 family)